MTKDKDFYLKSIDIVQSAISRMAENSSKLKSWFIPTFIAILGVVTGKISDNSTHSHSALDLIWCLPLILFVILDGYYLRQERLFRLVYEDFSSSIVGSPTEGRSPFNLRPTAKQRKDTSLLSSIFSISVSGFYFLPVTAIQAYILTTNTCHGWFSIFLPLIWIAFGLFCSRKTHHRDVSE